MKLLFFCPRWGQEHISWNDFFQKVKAAGYDGIEASLPFDEEAKEEILEGLEKHRLLFIGQHWETVERHFELHCAEYEKRLRHLAAAKPLFINTQTGKDYYSFGQNATLLSLASKVAKETGVPVVHETHRGKFSFAAHITKTYLEQMPHLKLTLDISHWCAVAETLLHDQTETVDLAISRTAHIHARVGHTQGPQITDPRAPESKEALAFHLDCWGKVIALKKNAGEASCTITPEFGAPPYLPLFPYTQQPIVDQWQINVFMMELLRKCYE